MTLEPQGSQSDTARSPMAPNESALIQAASGAAARPLQKKFVVLATPRSGSSHLVDLLDSHPQLNCLGEVYNPHGAALRKFGLRNKKDMTQAGKDPVEFLQRVMDKVGEEENPKPSFGFKLMLHHDPRVIDHILDHPEWAVIVLERENLLAQWTSAGLAKKTGKWGGTGGVKKAQQAAEDSAAAEADADDEDDDLDADDDKDDDEPTKVVFNAAKYEAYCVRMKARYASIYHRLGDRPYFKLYSEDIDASHPRLLEFLGAHGVEMQSSRPRQNSSSMRDRIKNYESYVRYAKKNSLPVA